VQQVGSSSTTVTVAATEAHFQLNTSALPLLCCRLCHAVLQPRTFRSKQAREP
jgi:hypothetical protein